MRKRLSTRPTLEVLEDRWVPATYSFYNGTLSITGQTNSLAITQSAANKFQIKDGTGATVTYSGVSNILATTPNGNDTVTVDLGGLTYTGALTIKTGNGNSTVNLGAASGGAILGNVLVSSGFGTEMLNVDTAGTATMTLGGNLQVVDQNSLSTVNFGTAAVTTPSGIPLTIKGSVSLTGVDNVFFNSNQNDQFLGTFTATTASSAVPITFEQVAPGPIGGPPFTTGLGALTFGKAVQVTGGNGPSTVLFGAATFNGNLTVTTGSNGFTDPFAGVLRVSLTAFALSDYGNGLGTVFTTTVNGNVTFNNGSGAVLASYQATVINGNLNLNLGTSNTRLQLDQINSPTQLGVINGNLTVNDTGFVNTQVSGFLGIQDIINGNVTFNLGNGGTLANPNLIVFDQDSSGFGSVSGVITVNAGNGVNQLLFDTPFAASPVTYNVYATFGSGTNTVTLDNSAAILVGSLIGSTAGTNTFTVTAGTIGSPFFIQGF